MRKVNFKNWSLWRIIRLVLGSVILITGAFTVDFILIAAGVFLLVQAWLNTCVSCANGACEVPSEKQFKKVQ